VVHTKEKSSSLQLHNKEIVSPIQIKMSQLSILPNLSKTCTYPQPYETAHKKQACIWEELNLGGGTNNTLALPTNQSSIDKKKHKYF